MSESEREALREAARAVAWSARFLRSVILSGESLSPRDDLLVTTRLQALRAALSPGPSPEAEREALRRFVEHWEQADDRLDDEVMRTVEMARAALLTQAVGGSAQSGPVSAGYLPPTAALSPGPSPDPEREALRADYIQCGIGDCSFAVERGEGRTMALHQSEDHAGTSTLRRGAAVLAHLSRADGEVARAALSPGPEPEALRDALVNVLAAWENASDWDVSKSPSYREAITALNGTPITPQEVRAALSPGPEPVAGLDVERLARALDSIDHDLRVGDDTTTEQYAEFIAREYAALGKKP